MSLLTAINVKLAHEMSWEAIAAFTMLGITAITSLVLMMRGLARMETNHRVYFEKRLGEMQNVLHSDINDSREMFGESIKAVKEHSIQAHFKYDALMIAHQKLELYLRDHYVEIDSFNVALARIERTMDSIDLKVDNLISRKA